MQKRVDDLVLENEALMWGGSEKENSPEVKGRTFVKDGKSRANSRFARVPSVCLDFDNILFLQNPLRGIRILCGLKSPVLLCLVSFVVGELWWVLVW